MWKSSQASNPQSLTSTSIFFQQPRMNPRVPRDNTWIRWLMDGDHCWMIAKDGDGELLSMVSYSQHLEIRGFLYRKWLVFSTSGNSRFPVQEMTCIGSYWVNSLCNEANRRPFPIIGVKIWFPKMCLKFEFLSILLSRFSKILVESEYLFSCAGKSRKRILVWDTKWYKSIIDELWMVYANL